MLNVLNSVNVKPFLKRHDQSRVWVNEEDYDNFTTYRIVHKVKVCK